MIYTGFIHSSRWIARFLVAQFKVDHKIFSGVW